MKDKYESLWEFLFDLIGQMLGIIKTGLTPELLVEGCMNSPGHRDNILLDREVNFSVVAIYWGSDGVPYAAHLQSN